MKLSSSRSLSVKGRVTIEFDSIGINRWRVSAFIPGDV
ncbi:putative taurine dehydrogenase large subunit TauY domain protein [Brucella rhizosphaerae]|uniref:Putative taurine dehydrogenase large subunit TauY domain protein n=1 Tax=Brucella rhizosphaerae TaxID=571254 RepID=A0A256FU94_9HYPH|nr:putative taurine dehydrogenase large subunit TauY domain protein [Brucella rhizosphaerae]